MNSNLAILNEALHRSLNRGMLTATKPFNPMQTEALEASVSFFAAAESRNGMHRLRGFYDAATGTGKTGAFSTIIRDAHNVARERGMGEQFRSFIVEPTIDLLTQTHDALVEVAPELESAIGFYGDRQKELRRPVTIITYNSLLDLLESGQLQGSDISLHINDEAHNSLSIRRESALNDKLAETIHLGFTATAAYDADKTLVQTHFNKIYGLDLPSAVERGLLSDYIHAQYGIMRILPTSMDKEDVDLTNAEFTFIKRQEWARAVVHAYATMLDGVSGQPLSDKIGAIFGADTRHADTIASMLNNHPGLQQKARLRGFDAVATSIHTVGLSGSISKARMQDFRAGRYMVGVSDKKIQVGFDYPRIKFTSSYPGDSPVDTIQEIGRGVRPYFDPVSGELQGAVAFEAVPYIGSNNPEKDSKSRDRALERYVTAYKVLKGTLILSPGRKVKLASEPRGESVPRTLIRLSDSCTIESFWTAEDTVTVSRLFDDAQINKIRVTTAMIETMRQKLESVGNPGPKTLSEQIAQYEADHKLTPINMAYSHLSWLANPPGFIQADEWQRLNNVIDSWPEDKKRLVLDEENLKILRDAASALKSKARVIVYKIQEYETSRGLASTGITYGQLHEVMVGHTRTISMQQWNRLWEVLNPLLQEKERLDKERAQQKPIVITEAMSQKLKLQMQEHGVGARRLFKAGNKYDATHSLPSIGITEKHIDHILSGNAKRFPLNKWQRLNLWIEGLATETTVQRKKYPDALSPKAIEKMIGTLVDKSVVASFAGVADDLVARITAAVVTQLGSPHGIRKPIDSHTPPRGQPKVATKSRKHASPEIAESITETPPEPAPVPVVSISQPAAELAPAPAAENNGGFTQLAFTPRFGKFNASLFAKPDARGDSMLSLLTNAERAFMYSDPIGFKANLRKFAEVMMHRTLTSVNGKYLASLDILPIYRARIEKVVRDYGYTCASVEISETQGSGSNKLEPLIKLSDITKPFREFVSLVKVAKPEAMPLPLNDHIHDILATGGDIHLQIKERNNPSEAQVLQHAFDLANWFDGQFCKSEVTLEAEQKNTQTVITPAAPAVSESPVIATPVGHTVPATDVIDTPDDDEPPLQIPRTLLKVLGVTQENLLEEINGSRGQHFKSIVAFAQQWVGEDAATKRARNRLCTKLYADAAPIVGQMASDGKNIAQIIVALIDQNIGYNVNHKPVDWNPDMLLRGAVLTSGSLPLEIFALGRTTTIDGANISSKKAPKL